MPSVPKPRITYSLADQSFSRTKSIGILNVSTQLLRHLCVDPRVGRCAVLGNPSVLAGLDLPASVELRSYSRPASSAIQRVIWDQWGVHKAARNTGNEWLFLPKGFCSWLPLNGVRQAAFVHDVIHEFYRGDSPFGKAEELYFRYSFRATLKQASVIFTNSEFTRAEVLETAGRYGIPAPPVVFAGIGFECCSGWAVKENRILVLTGAWPHKKARLAVDFLSRWQEKKGYAGIIEWVGAFPPGLVLPDFPNWRRANRLDEEAFRQQFRAARVMVYCSGYEGFGMPPVEAAIQGVAPVYSRLSATAEVMGTTGFSFSNDSYEEFARALDSALAADHRQLTEWSKTLAARHNWTAVADRIARGLINVSQARGAE